MIGKNSLAAPEIMTPEQVAEYLQISPATVYRYIRGGKLVAFHIGPQYRISRENLDAFLFATATVPSGLREYSAEDVAQFLEEDEIDSKTREIGERLLQGLRSRK